MFEYRVGAEFKLAGQSSSIINILAKSLFLALFIMISSSNSDAMAKNTDKTDVVRRVLIIGDSLGGSLWNGVYHHYHGDRSVKLIRHTRVSTGIAREDEYDWNKAAKQLVKRHKIDIVLMLIGGNDGQPIRVKGKRYRERFGTQPWQKTYGDRVEALINTFQEAGAKFYWVGMPIQRSRRQDKFGRTINDIFAERCKKTGARYIDIYKMFSAPSGHYSARLKNEKGRRHLMRARDGIHFATHGVLWLGRVVGKIVDDDYTASLKTAMNDKPLSTANTKPDAVAVSNATGNSILQVKTQTGGRP